MPTLWTVGHSTLDGGAFAALVGEAGMQAIVDVRRFPGNAACWRTTWFSSTGGTSNMSCTTADAPTTG